MNTLFDQLPDPDQVFDRDNPGVYALFVKLANDVRGRGKARYSARAIVHRMRWWYEFEVKENAEFKINDHSAEYMARRLATEQPEQFGRFFEFRRSRFDRKGSAA